MPCASWRSVLVSTVALQLWFCLARIALMNGGRTRSPPASSAARCIRLLSGEAAKSPGLRQWVDDEQHRRRTLKRAVIASEDDGFAEHSGVEWDVDWDAAWDKNQRAEAVAERRNAQLEARQKAQEARAAQRGAAPPATPAKPGGRAQNHRRIDHLASSWPRTCSCLASARVLRKGAGARPDA